jgi:hypothetical protein
MSRLGQLLQGQPGRLLLRGLAGRAFSLGSDLDPVTIHPDCHPKGRVVEVRAFKEAVGGKAP